MKIEFEWTGPYSWPRYETENGLPQLPAHTGVYLQTTDYLEGYIIYASGLTRRPFRKRFTEHTRKYLRGDYTVLDIASLRAGIREEIWHGWGWTDGKRAEFAARQREIFVAAERQLAGFRIFVADVPTDERIPERLEAAVMGYLYEASSPFCDIPDRGMQLSPRWQSERPLTARAACSARLHGLPETLVI
jgi:hypothetical protein